MSPKIALQGGYVFVGIGLFVCCTMTWKVNGSSQKIEDDLAMIQVTTDWIVGSSG